MKYFLFCIFFLLFSCTQQTDSSRKSFLKREWQVISANQDIFFAEGNALTFNNKNRKCAINGLAHYNYTINDSLILIEGHSLKQLYSFHYCDSILFFYPLFTETKKPIRFALKANYISKSIQNRNYKNES